MKTLIGLPGALSILLFTVSTFSNVLENGYDRGNGYDCGSVFFSDREIQEALKLASTYEGKAGIRKYVGSLYDVKVGYLKWPIRPEDSPYKMKKFSVASLWRKATYQIIFDKSYTVIDMLVRLTNNDFAKCGRVDKSQVETQSSDAQEVIGYRCGNRFIPNKDLYTSLALALHYLKEGRVYPEKYRGKLYDSELGYMTWPIYRGQIIYQYPSVPGGPYFIVMDPEGGLKDVIVRTATEGFVKCIISREGEQISALEEQVGDIVKSSRSGFDCLGVFFDDEYLDLAKNMAKDVHTTVGRNVYPREYSGPPFDSPCLLWPIRPSNNKLMSGRLSSYRLVLTLDFKVMCVVMQGLDMMKKCEKKTVSGDILDHDQNDYQCQDEMFTHRELVSTAEIACQKKNPYDIT